MRFSWSSIASALTVVALTACLHHAKQGLQPVATDTPDVEGRGSATIITAGILQQQSRTLLDVMQARVPSLTVVPTQPCPDVFLRGRSTITTPSNPAIYVDGQRTLDTCVLQMLNSMDLDHVEIYPFGVAPHGTGYPNDPYGLILIFVRTS